MAHERQVSGPLSTLAPRVSAVLSELVAKPLPPGLYVVATPIGNLGDITLRALAVLGGADVIYCEDTRHSRTLLAHYGISRPTRAYHEHNAERERPRVLAELAAGKSIALISDAGTPLVSDPGYKLVRAAVAAGHTVTSLPGPSAILASLAVAGIATDAFLFAGFLPPKQKARRTRLEELASVPATLLFFEAPSRLAESLDDIAAVLGDREVGGGARAHQALRGGAPRHPRRTGTVGSNGGAQRRDGHPGRPPRLPRSSRTRRSSPASSRCSRTQASATRPELVARELRIPRNRAYALALGLKQGDAP